MWQIALLLGLLTCVGGAAEDEPILDEHPTTIKLDFIGALAVAVSAISIESTLESYLSRSGRWRCALTGPGYLQTGLNVAVDVFKHITTLHISDAVNRPWKLVETVEPTTYKLGDRKPHPIQCGYLATIFARHTTHSLIISPWSDKRTEGTVCWLKQSEEELKPGRLAAPWYTYFLWVGSIIVTAAPLGVAVWQHDWWMSAFGAALIADAILRTLYAAASNMTYNLEQVLVKKDTEQPSNDPVQPTNDPPRLGTDPISWRNDSTWRKEQILAQYGDGVCIITGTASIVEGACRSKVIGNSVPQSLAVAYSISSLIQLLGNLVAVPNGGAYAQLTYLGTLTLCFALQLCSHRLRTRVGQDDHQVISSSLATRTEAVAYTAYLTLCHTEKYQQLDILPPGPLYKDWWISLEGDLALGRQTYIGRAMRTVPKGVDQYVQSYYADIPTTMWQGKGESLIRGLTRAQYHWSQPPLSYNLQYVDWRREIEQHRVDVERPVPSNEPISSL